MVETNGMNIAADFLHFVEHNEDITLVDKKG